MLRKVSAGFGVLVLLSGVGQGQPAPAPATQATIPMTPDGFVETAAFSDMYEIQAGELAESRGQTTEIKAFGRHMVDGHRKTTADLKSIVARNNLNIAPPAQLDAKHQDMIDALRSASANDFDQVYIHQQNSAHLDALALMQTYAATGASPPLKQFAARTVPIINEHIAMLRDVRK
jgi:putative membrane protein